MIDRFLIESPLKRDELCYSFVENLPIAAAILDRNLTYLMTSQRWLSDLKLNNQDIMGRLHTEIFPQGCDLQESLQRCLAEATEFSVEESFQQADGSLGWRQWNLRPWREKAGSIGGVMLTIEDITARKQAEAILQQSKAELEQQVQERTQELQAVVARLQDEIQAQKQSEDITLRKQTELRLSQLAAIVESSEDAIVSKTLEGVIVSWNAGAERLFGYTASEVIGQHISLVFPPDRLDEEPKILEKLRRGERVEHFETLRKRKDGTLVEISLTISPVRDATGTIIGASKIARDISEQQAALRVRRQAEEALQQSELELRRKAQELEQTLQELQQTQSQLIQSEKMSSLGQLVAGVAHEINNPVNFIYGNLTYANGYIQDLLELLKLYRQHCPSSHPAIQEQAEAIDLEFVIQDLPKLLASMKVGADRIQNIVLALRNFSRMDEAEVKKVNIHDGIDSTLMILQSRLKSMPGRPAIQVIKEYGDLPLVECYAGQLNQVFMNILSNAIDALEEADQNRTAQCLEPKPAQIRISTTMSGANQVQICIADNGPGIPQTLQARLFDPFFTTKPIGKGTGLGMSISYQIVTQRHGGSLQCHSTLGHGAEFTIEIPTQSIKQENIKGE